MLYYFRITIAGDNHFLGMASLYGTPCPELMDLSCRTYCSVPHTHTLEVVNVCSINALVMAAPDMRYRELKQDGTENDRWVIVRKPGQNCWRK